MPPSLPVCLPVLPPSTTNRSSWKNWDTTVCLCTPSSSASFWLVVGRYHLFKSCPSIHFEAPNTELERWRIRAASSSSVAPPTFSTCNSLSPFCISSCTFLASVSVLCSRNASLVLLPAYSLKLYAANCFDWRNSERYSERTSKAVVLDMPCVGSGIVGVALRGSW